MAETLNVVVFSKDRPLQLLGYLESLEFNLLVTPLKPMAINVTVVAPRPTPEYSQIMARDFPRFETDWWFEDAYGGFNESVRSLISILHPRSYLLFGVDDCVWINPVNVSQVCLALDASSRLFGTALRLKPIDGKQVWWCNDYPIEAHHGYVFDVVDIVYRTRDIQIWMDEDREPWDIPNDVEIAGLHYFRRVNRMLSSTGKAHVVHQEINRVQDKYENGVASNYWTAEVCLEHFRNGKRLDWMRMQGIDPAHPAVGERYMRVI